MGFDVNNNWSLSRVQEIADLEAGTMRPTPVTLQNGNNLTVFLMGGRSDRSSIMLNNSFSGWELSPKLPVGHPLTTFVAVNYLNEAIFTFSQDSQMTIRSAVLDMATASWTPSD